VVLNAGIGERGDFLDTSNATETLEQTLDVDLRAVITGGLTRFPAATDLCWVEQGCQLQHATSSSSQHASYLIILAGWSVPANARRSHGLSITNAVMVPEM
jgi:hypothetical protein